MKQKQLDIVGQEIYTALKELEYLEKICEKVGEISVGGNAGIVEQLGKLIGMRKAV